MTALGRANMDRSPLGRAPARVAPSRSSQHPLARLQRQFGNQAVAGMLQRAAEEEELQAKPDLALQRAEEDELQAKADVSIQREGDDEELQMARDPAIQREGDEEELQMARDPMLQRVEEDELQAKAEVGLEGGPVSDATAGRIQAMRGGGQAMDAGTRGSMERAFGTSLGDVRLHTGSEASDVSRRVGALAFTTGNDVFLRDDAYKPGSPDGQKLLTHELTHVVQQRTMPSRGGGMQVGPAGDHYEQAADAKAAEVATQRMAEEQG